MFYVYSISVPKAIVDIEQKIHMASAADFFTMRHKL